MSPSDIAINKFSEVAALAARQELILRLLANKTKAIKDAAYEYSVADTERRVIKHFSCAGHLDATQSNLLKRSRQIRNKILHCKFNEAVKRIEKLAGRKAPGPTVKVIRVDPDADGGDLLETMFQAQEDIARGRKGSNIEASKIKDDIFAELLNCVQTGAMDIAIEIFVRSNEVLSTLMKAAPEPAHNLSSGKQKKRSVRDLFRVFNSLDIKTIEVKTGSFFRKIGDFVKRQNKS